MLDTYREMQEQNRREIAALTAALTAYDENLSPPASPQALPADFVLKAVEQPILERVRTNVLAMIEELRMGVASMLQSRNKEMYEAMWTKLNLTVTMVESLAAKIVEEEGDGVVIKR